MLARPETADYMLDNYGTCDRGADCYWGKDERGNRNGCLFAGWLGRKCAHWQPAGWLTPEQIAPQ
jgi:hypothetical protein